MGVVVPGGRVLMGADLEIWVCGLPLVTIVCVCVCVYSHAINREWNGTGLGILSSPEKQTSFFLSLFIYFFLPHPCRSVSFTEIKDP